MAVTQSVWAGQEIISTNDVYNKWANFYGVNVTIDGSNSGWGQGISVREGYPVVRYTSNGRVLRSIVLTITYGHETAGDVTASLGTCTVSGEGSGTTYVTINDINAQSVEITSTNEVDVPSVTVNYFTPATGITLSQTEGNVALDKTLTLIPTILPEDDSDKTVEWTSSDETVATVDGDGVVTGHMFGTATITATATNGTPDTSDDKTATCEITVTSALSTDASGAYLINNLSEWNDFCKDVNNGFSYSGKTVKLTAEIVGITTVVGTNEANSFQGIFDGQGNTLNFDITNNDVAPAPFSYIKNATIRNLVVAGSITSNKNHMSGLAKSTYGNILIENCNVAATISGANYMGGYIGHGLNANITLRGCVFSGTLSPTGSNNIGGFIGWGGNGDHTFVIADCLFNGKVTGSVSTHFHPVGCYNNPTTQNRTITNTYYTLAAKNMDEDTYNNSFVKGLAANSKGKMARSINIGTDVNALTISGAGTEYSVSGITAYATGIKYGGVYYAGNGDEVNLTLTPKEPATGYHVSQYNSATKVGFSKGNLQATYSGSNWTWAFATNQWDYIGTSGANANVTTTSPYISGSSGTVDMFGWVGASSTWTAINKYGITSAGQNDTYINKTNGYGNVDDESLKCDWGELMCYGWYTLSKDEWNYILNTRVVNGGTGSGKSYTAGQSVNGVLGLVIYPDDYTGAVYAGSDWETFEAAGCVFLPASGWRNGTSITNVGSTGFYWTSTPLDVTGSYRLRVRNANPDLSTNGRAFGFSVRLVNGEPADGQLSGRFTISNVSGAVSIQSATEATLTMIDAGQTISAVYQPIVYNLSYNLDGGSASNPATYTIESSDITLTAPTKDGFTFMGWRGTGIDGTVASVTIDAGSIGDRSYTAVWDRVILADGTEYTRTADAEEYSVTYRKTLDESRVNKHQPWLVPFDYTITDADVEKFSFFKINMIANSPDPEQEANGDMWLFVKPMEAGDMMRANMPYLYKPKSAVADYEFTTDNTVLKAKTSEVRITMMTAENTYTIYATYAPTTATSEDPFYYMNTDGTMSLGNDGSVTVGAFRWIMRVENKYGGVSPAAYAPRVIIFDGDETPGIETIHNDGWYSLDG